MMEMVDYISDGSEFEVEYLSNSDSLSHESVSSSDLIYQSALGCKQTKYKDFHGYLETSASNDSDTDDFTGFDFSWKTDDLQNEIAIYTHELEAAKFNIPRKHSHSIISSYFGTAMYGIDW